MAMTDPGPGETATWRDSLFDFPCSFPIKAIGLAESGIEGVVLEVLARHAPGFDSAAVTLRSSRGGKWLAVTVVIQADSRDQLDAIYRDLTDHQAVVWAL